MNVKKKDYAAVIIFGMITAYIAYAIDKAELSNIISDYTGHVYVYLPMLLKKETFFQGLGAAPYFLWHLVTIIGYKIFGIPLEYAAGYSNALFALFSYITVYFFVSSLYKRAGKEARSSVIAIISFGMCILQPIAADWSNVWILSVAPITPNPVTNPTYMATRGFAVLAFCLVIDIWGRQENDDYKGIFFKVENGLKRYYIALLIILLLSVLAKPTFVEMFIPAVGIVMLARWIKRVAKKDGSAKEYFKILVTTFLSAVPAIVVVFVQFLMYFIFGGSYGEGGSVVITPFLQVWRMFTDNAGISIIRALLFVMFVMLIRTVPFIDSNAGRLALVCFVVSFLQGAFLGESTKLGHGDFMWPLMSAMFLLFLAALKALIMHDEKEDRPFAGALTVTAWTIFALHVACGVMLIVKELFVLV